MRAQEDDMPVFQEQCGKYCLRGESQMTKTVGCLRRVPGVELTPQKKIRTEWPSMFEGKNAKTCA